MSEADEFDQLLENAGSMKASVDNDSIQNNFDRRSDRSRDLNMIGDNYQNQYQKMHSLNLSKDFSKVDNKQQHFQEGSLEYRLLNSQAFEDYDQALTQLISSMGIYSNLRLINMMKIILQQRRNQPNELIELSRNCIFLKQLSLKLKEIQNIESYKDVIGQILKQKQRIYSYNFQEQSIQLMNLYLEEQNLELNSIHEFINQYFESEMKISITNPLNYFYRYIHKMFMQSCFREGKSLFNLFLIAQANPYDFPQYIRQYQSYLLIKKNGFIQLDRKDMDEYFQQLMQICKQHQDMIEKYIFPSINWLLTESQQIEKKLQGFRIVNELVTEAKKKDNIKYILVNWLTQNRIIDEFLKDSTHSRILQQIQPIINFLYEAGVLADSEIIQLMKNSLHSEEIFKVAQSMLGWLKLKQLSLVFEIIPYHTDKQSTLFINFISSILSNPIISSEDSTSRKKKNLILQDNRREMEAETEMDIEEYPEPTQQFIKKLMHLLVELVVQYQSGYMPILIKLITAHSLMFKDQLEFEIIRLFRNGSVCSLWIVEHWLKIETARDRGQGKYELITKLASQGVFEFILALMARNRFCKSVVEKALSVIIMFCRFNRPLEKNITEFLWKVLGTTGRDEKQREQFFVFLKEVVRYEGSITEESVNFIFFDILMSLVAGWFSLRVYDCLQMLFLRLNEDCKLIIFERDHYKIIKDQLIGTDKFMYIYFNCMDLKVVKKCRDFMCKLIVNSEQTKEAMYMYVINSLKKYMMYTFQMNKNDEVNKRQIIILRVFQLAEKLYLEKEKIEESKENTINLQITVTNMQFFGARNSNMEFNQKITLSDLRCYIGDNLNPPTKQIQLWTKGKLLKGQNLTLKQLKLQNNQTISVTNADSMEIEQDKNQKKKQQLEILTAIVGEDVDPELLKFIINKFEGQSIETIVNDVIDPDRMKVFENEFKDNKFQKEQIIIEVENPKEKAKNFGTLLVHQREILQMLLECLKISQNKVSGWTFIKKLPLNEAYVSEVNQYIQNGRWEKLFQNRITEHSIYIIHIISNYLKQNPSQVTIIFEKKRFRMYLIEWLSTIIMERPDEISNYQDLFKLLLVQTECPVVTLLDQFLHNKTMSQKDYQIIPLFQNSLQDQNRWCFGLSQDVAARMIDSLLLYPFSDRMAALIAKLYILQLIYPSNRQKYYSLLTYNRLEVLLLRYGRPIQFIVIATALHLSSEDNDYFLLKFTFRLLSSFRQNIQNKDHKYAYSSFFSCLNALITISSVNDSGQQLTILTDILYQVKNQIYKLEEEEVIGYFKLAVNLLDRHFKADKGGQRKNQDMHKIAIWLFNDYLFGRNNKYPYYTSKHLRKAAYQLLLKMCAYHDILKMIINSIRQIMKGFKDTNEVQGEFRNTEFIGIRNLGATCYINSLIQQLYHTSFPTILLEDDNQSSNCIKLLQLKKIFANLYCGIRSPVYPNQYVDTVKINGELVRPMVQQDANEFFASLMHDVEQTVGSKAQNQTILGSLTHQIRGLEEGSQIKNVDETFLTLMIDIKYKKNLLEGLTSLSKPHVLEGQNMYYSEVLHKKIRASSKTYLGKLPNILVITLKRFYWNFQQMNRIKINDYFEFPMELQLSRFAMQGRKQNDPHYFDYKLCGILIHSGSAQSGHYYSFIKVGEKWLQFNDRKVSEWDIQSNLKSQCFGGNEQKSKNAYMLFYERVDSQAHGCSISKLPPNNKLLELVLKQNENFVLNRLVYDSNYIDFIKELSRFEQNGNIISVLDSLKYYRQTPEVFFEKPQEKAEENKDQKRKEEIQPVKEAMVDQEESTPLLEDRGPPKVTSRQLKQLAQRHYPGKKNLIEPMDEEETPFFN